MRAGLMIPCYIGMFYPPGRGGDPGAGRRVMAIGRLLAGADCVPERLGSLPDGLTSCDRAGRAGRRNCRQFTR